MSLYRVSSIVFRALYVTGTTAVSATVKTVCPCNVATGAAFVTTTRYHDSTNRTNPYTQQHTHGTALVILRSATNAWISPCVYVSGHSVAPRSTGGWPPGGRRTSTAWYRVVNGHTPVSSNVSRFSYTVTWRRKGGFAICKRSVGVLIEW